MAFPQFSSRAILLSHAPRLCVSSRIRGSVGFGAGSVGFGAGRAVFGVGRAKFGAGRIRGSVGFGAGRAVFGVGRARFGAGRVNAREEDDDGLFVDDGISPEVIAKNVRIVVRNSRLILDHLDPKRRMRMKKLEITYVHGSAAGRLYSLIYPFWNKYFLIVCLTVLFLLALGKFQTKNMSWFFKWMGRNITWWLLR
ncbi:hypothetical protein PTKIN_Ptkin08bG0205600 [Pterospermum kingtungense]